MWSGLYQSGLYQSGLYQSGLVNSGNRHGVPLTTQKRESIFFVCFYVRDNDFSIMTDDHSVLVSLLASHMLVLVLAFFCSVQKFNYVVGLIVKLGL